LTNLQEVISSYQVLQGWRANFVVNLEGSFTDASGSSRGVSSPEDRLLLVHLRSISDVVLVSAKSASAENLSSTKATTLAIVAGSGSLPHIPALAENNRVLVLAPQNSDDVVKLDDSATARLVLVANKIKGRISEGELADTVKSLGFQAPISEFGPDWLRQLSNAGVLDELCLTITKSPDQNFKAETPLLAIQRLIPDSIFELASAAEVENTLFTRWVKK
jgi:riboflavin biosynthesis pyrimidine reductase